MKNKSKLNMILLVIIIILAVFGFVYFFLNNQKKETVGNLLQESEVVNNILANKDKTLYINNELGFSFVSPYGELKKNTYDTSEGQKETPFITKGTKGESFRGYILRYPDPIFHFAGMTPDYSGERGIDCGEVSSVEKYESTASIYGEIKNSNGIPYVYGYVTDNEMEGPHQIAYFKLNKGQFPVLGFCAIGMNESDFKSVINTVKIEK